MYDGFKGQYVFNKPPKPEDIEVLEAQVRDRGTKNEEIRRWLMQAKAETEYAKLSKVHDVAIIIV